MSLNFARSVTKEAVDIEWPDNREILFHWIPKSTTMVYNARSSEQLGTLLSRLPKVWSEAEVVPFKEWFFMSNLEKEKYVGKHLILTRYVARDEICHVPGVLFFIPNSVIIEEGGRFTELRDQSGFKWGDVHQKIISSDVLNGNVVFDSAMSAGKRLCAKVQKYIPLSDVTVVGVETPGAIDIVKSKHTDEWATAPHFTLDEWDKLSEAELNELILTSYYIVLNAKYEIATPTALTFLARRCICEANDEFIVTRDQRGLSGITL
jgi:hypothetical protein